MTRTENRRRALVDTLAGDVDAILVTGLVNVRYLTGFAGSNAAVLVPRDGAAVLATDGRYDEQARTEAPDVRVLITRALAADLVATARSQGIRRLGIERHHMTLSQHDALLAAADGVELVGQGPVVEPLRMHKDDDEIRMLRRACAATDAAFADVLDQLRPGITEREFAWALEAAMRRAGAEASAFESIVAFGTHSAIPHHRPTDRPLQPGDLVKLDFGARVGGYHADMTRTVVSGPAQDWQRELHARVLDVQAQCRAATVVGAAPADLQDFAQALMEDSGQTMVHGLGHGVGLEIHELPFLTPSSDSPALAADLPVTVEPGVYLPERGGVRIEDTVLVGSGPPEVLTPSPYELLEI